MVVRDEASRLRAYSRVCRHRAFFIVSGEGNAKRFVCPYHRWAYDLSGELKAAPLMEKVGGFERKDCRLPELALEEWLGFVFVSLDTRAESLAPQIEPLRDLFAPQAVSDLVTGEDPFWVTQVFPTFLFAMFRGEGHERRGYGYEMQIDRHDHFELHIHLLIPPERADDAAALTLEREGTQLVHSEDITICDGIQQGLQSELWRPGRLSRQEKTLWLFHRYLADPLAPRGSQG